jgi:hypothetical protein
MGWITEDCESVELLYLTLIPPPDGDDVCIDTSPGQLPPQGAGQEAESAMVAPSEELGGDEADFQWEPPGVIID